MADYPRRTPVSTYVVTIAIVAVVVGAGAYFLTSDRSGEPGVAQQPAAQAPMTPSPAPGAPASPPPSGPTTPTR